MDAIVLAGGFGTRLRSIIKDIPKPMADINGKPFLVYLLNQLVKIGIGKIVLAVGYKSEIIINYFGNEYKGIKLEYSIENEPLGTGGCIKKALKNCNGEVLILNGDSYFNVNFDKMREVKSNSNADIVIASKLLYNTSRYGTLKCKNNRIVEFQEKKFALKAYINCGVYLTNSDLFGNYTFNDSFSFEKDFLQFYSDKINIQMHLSEGFFIDIGIPEDYEIAKKYFVGW